MHQSTVEAAKLLEKIQEDSNARNIMVHYTIRIGQLVAPFISHLMVTAIAAIILRGGIEETMKPVIAAPEIKEQVKKEEVNKKPTFNDGAAGSSDLAVIQEDFTDLEHPAEIKEDPAPIQTQSNSYRGLDVIAKMLIKHMDVVSATGIWIVCGQSKNPIIKDAAAAVSAALLGRSIINTAVSLKQTLLGA